MARDYRNLVFVYTDEQAAATMAAYGNGRIQTPNLNRFAAQCTVFDQAYVTQPVCTPSRSTLLTGLYPHTNGCTENNLALRPDTLCFPEMTRRREYVSGHFGKWHLGDEIFPQHGFSHWRGIDDAYASYYSPERSREARSEYHHFLVANGFRPSNGHTFGRSEVAQFPEEVSKPAFLAREARRFLAANRARPFVLFVNFFEPHMPFSGPRNRQYHPDELPLPANFTALPTTEQPLKTRLFQRAYAERGLGGMPLRTETDWRRIRANYWGLCSQVDTHFGRILEALEEFELSDDTIVVYTSDHGDMMGSHQLIAKCVQFEESTRVPLLVRLPGQRDSRRITGPFSQIDLVPTLLDLMGEELPAHLQGCSRRRLMEAGADVRLEEDVVIEWNGANSGVVADRLRTPNLPDTLPGWMAELGTAAELTSAISDPVRTLISADGWKFTCSPRGEHELYDLHRDPGETTNLAGLDEQRSCLRDLRVRLLQWQRRTGDAVMLPEI